MGGLVYTTKKDDPIINSEYKPMIIELGATGFSFRGEGFYTLCIQVSQLLYRWRGFGAPKIILACAEKDPDEEVEEEDEDEEEIDLTGFYFGRGFVNIKPSIDASADDQWKHQSDYVQQYGLHLEMYGRRCKERYVPMQLRGYLEYDFSNEDANDADDEDANDADDEDANDDDGGDDGGGGGGGDDDDDDDDSSFANEGANDADDEDGDGGGGAVDDDDSRAVVVKTKMVEMTEERKGVEKKEYGKKKRGNVAVQQTRRIER